MIVAQKKPSGIWAEELTVIGCQVLMDAGAFMMSTLSFTATSPTGKVLTAISGNSIQSGWSGTITSDAAGGIATWFDIQLTSWPYEIAAGAGWTFDLTVTQLGDP